MESLRACRAGRSRPGPLRYPILASSAGAPNAAAATTTELIATKATQALAAGRLPETLALSTSSAHAPHTSPTAMPVKTKVVPDVNALQGASRSRSMEALKTCRGVTIPKVGGVCEVSDGEKEPARRKRMRYAEAEAEAEGKLPPPF